jgi:uridylate kinase
MEIKAEVIMKATKVDGIYSADPVKKPDAAFFPEISYFDVMNQGLGVMDTTAISLCKDNRMPILVFNIRTDGNISRAVMGEKIGSLVHSMEKRS